MMKGKLLNPQILFALAQCGHFTKILLGDGNYPYASMCNPQATKVFLNLMPGVPTVTQVLDALSSAVVFQEAKVVAPPDDSFRGVHQEYAKYLPSDVKISEMERFAFYNEVKSSDTALVIATGDTRRFANLLLTVGVVKI